MSLGVEGRLETYVELLLQAPKPFVPHIYDALPQSVSMGDIAVL
jgi:hypothetical protein